MIKTGFIGLGAMGAPMAGHLHRHGLLAAVWNRSREKAERFAETHEAIEVADAPASLAGRVDVVLVCVSADDDLRRVLADLEPGLRPGMTVVDHSTVSPATAREMAARMQSLEVAFVDAPVTGGVEGAKNGQLAIMAGGDQAAFDRLESVFATYGKAWRYLGSAGAGQSAKAVNQLIVAGIAEAVCEALAVVEKLGLPQDEMLELLGGGAAGNWFLEKRGKTMLADSFETGFDPKLLFKDLKICASLLDELSFESSVLPNALKDYEILVKTGQGRGDISSLIRLKRGA